MSPKEMTNEELRRVLLTCDGKGVATKTEALTILLEREADALRKENEELAEALEGIRMTLPSERSWTPEERQVAIVYNARAARLAEKSDAEERR